jgi:hypothetical protein
MKNSNFTVCFFSNLKTKLRFCERMSIPFPPNTPINADEFYGAKGSGSDEEFSRKRVSISYTIDGRKMQDGILLKPYEPEQLWKELFTRTFIYQLCVTAVTKETSRSVNPRRINIT